MDVVCSLASRLVLTAGLAGGPHGTRGNVTLDPSRAGRMHL